MTNKELKNISKEDVSILSDENLDTLTSNLALTDDKNRQIIFANEDEATIYASQLQFNHPEIRFCKLVKCFSINCGTFYIVEPMRTEKSQTDNFDLSNNDDFVLCSEITLLAIIEKAKRRKQAEGITIE